MSSLFILIHTGTAEGFSWYGLGSSMLWVPGNYCAMSAVQILGVATAQSTWAGIIVTVSFLESTLAFGEKPGNLGLAVFGLIILVVGIAILARASAPEEAEGSDRDYVELQLDDEGDKRAVVPKSRALGFAFVSVTGLLAGSVFVPLELDPKRKAGLYDGINALDFAYSQGITTGLATVFWIPLILTFQKYAQDKPFPQLFLGKAFLPGFTSGVLWNIGNVGAVLSTLPPLGAGIGYPLSQAALLVGCCWGIFWFKEIKKIRLFAIGATVVLVGMIIAGVFGKSA